MTIKNTGTLEEREWVYVSSGKMGEFGKSLRENQKIKPKILKIIT